MQRSWLAPCGVLLAFFVMLICIGVAVFGIMGLVVVREIQTEGPVFPIEVQLFTPTATPKVMRPVLQPTREASPSPSTPQPATEVSPSAQPEITSTQTPVFSAVSTDTLQTLENAVIPTSDLIDLAKRLRGIEDIPRTLEPPTAFFQVGDQKTFWATNVDTNESFQVTATLRYVTDHLYFWIENGVAYQATELRLLAETFEEKIYPTNRAFFGSEWTPGVDNDPHLYILLAGGLGSSIAGYYSSSDQVPSPAHIYSNAHEMFLLNADNIDLDSVFTYGVLAHEFQHMIHWYRDRNETSWLNEGFSELASFLNGYDVGGFDRLYTMNPDLQLNDWPNDSSATRPHYGASFLFVTYFLDRFGEQATQALVAHPENGMASIDAVLEELGILDPLTGQTIGADDVFADWVVASYLNDEQIADGRYTYSIYPSAPQPDDTETFSSCPAEAVTRDVRQYGVDYLKFTCKGQTTLVFEGSTVVGVVPVDPHSGSYAFWSNKGDESDMTLTRFFDFTDHSGELSLTYWTWYDLEEDYDYLYLEASQDGEYWEILRAPSSTDKNPAGNSYGWAYNGLSGNGPRWIHEKVDLSAYAGKQVYLRFEYITDAAVNGEGFLLDDVAIPEIGYSTDFENDDGGWKGEGFVRIQNLLPQTYRLSLITRGRETEVKNIPLTADMRAEIPIQIGEEVDEVILVISGTTRFTRQPTAYRIFIEPQRN